MGLGVDALRQRDQQRRNRFLAAVSAGAMAIAVVTIGLAVALVYALAFTHQREVLEFVAPEAGVGKVLAAAVLLLFVPALAYLYGNLAKSLLKLVKIE